MQSTRARLRDLTAGVLRPHLSAHELRAEVLEIGAILAAAADIDLADDAASVETQTPHGLAISPSAAAVCIDDHVRTVAFLRGAYEAIRDARRAAPHRPVRLLYAGCGPYAPLAIPLMAVLSPAEVIFTLLDIHPRSVESVNSIVGALRLEASVASCQTADAAACTIDPADQPDVILIELMQACLSTEPQVAVTRHLVEAAPDALLVPEEVRVELLMVDMTHEAQASGRRDASEAVEPGRVGVGTVFVLDRERALGWGDIGLDHLPAETLKLPAGGGRQPMLFTTVRVYGEHILEAYDSGLTYPRTPTIDGDLQNGGTVRFRYALGPRPGITGVVVK